MTSEPARRRRIGLFGGSFDPPHLGHLIMAQDALEQLGLDGIVFVPAAVSPHKQNGARADGGARLEMVLRAVGGDARFSVSDIELARGGVSYTIDTLLALKSSRPDTDWVLLFGADQLAAMDRWHRAEELLDLCETAVFRRPGTDDLKPVVESLDLPQRQREMLLSRILETRRIGISSTEIRERVRSGRSVRYLVPPAVEAYILENGFYRE